MNKIGIAVFATTAFASYLIGHYRGSLSGDSEIPHSASPSLAPSSVVQVAAGSNQCIPKQRTIAAGAGEIQEEFVQVGGLVEKSIDITQQSIPLELIPNSTITNYLDEYLDPEIASRVENPRQFASDLMQAMKSDDTQAPVAGRLNAYVSLSPVSGFRTVDSGVDLQQFNPVYIHLSALEADRIDVMLKWKHLQSGEIIHLDQSIVTNSTQTTYRSFKPDQGWQSGRYQIAAYDMHNANHLLSVVSFQVQDVYEQTPEQAQQINQDAINEMMSVGQAVSKNH